MTSATLPLRGAAQPPSPLYTRAHELDERVRRLGLRRRRDETYVGAAGDRSRADVQGEFVSPNSSADAAPEAPQRGRRARRPGGLPEPLGQELADALKALERLELKPREARERLGRALGSSSRWIVQRVPRREPPDDLMPMAGGSATPRGTRAAAPPSVRRRVRVRARSSVSARLR